MQIRITVTKRRLTLFAAVLFVVCLAWIFVFPFETLPQGKPTVHVSVLIAVPAEILVAVAVQRWTRGKPRYERLGLLAYLFTLVLCNGLVIDLLAILMGKFLLIRG